MKHILDQMSQNPSAKASPTAPDLSGFGDLFAIYEEQTEAERKERAAQQLQAIQAYDNQLTQALAMQHWAVNQVEVLSSRMELESLTKDQQATIGTELLPITKELFANLERTVALHIQLSAVKKLLMQRITGPSANSVAPVSALRGVAPLRLTGSK
jgi:hypothetical protein